jgi:hypothetical protein
MEVKKISIIKFKDFDDSNYEIKLILKESNIMILMKSLDDFTMYEKNLSLKMLLDIRPFQIIEEINNIFETIENGMKMEDSISLKKLNNGNILVNFNTFFVGKYSNSFELELTMNESVSQDFLYLQIIKELKILKSENELLRKDNEFLKIQNKNNKSNIDILEKEIFKLNQKFNNFAIYDINMDENFTMENYKFLCKNYFKGKFKFKCIFKEEGKNLDKSNSVFFKKLIKNKKNIFYIVTLKKKSAKHLGFFQTLVNDLDFNKENYLEDKDSFIVEFDKQRIFSADPNKTKHIRICPGYYFLFGNDSNYNGFFIRDDTTSQPNIYEKSEYFMMKGGNSAGFEFNNSDVEFLYVYLIDF